MKSWNVPLPFSSGSNVARSRKILAMSCICFICWNIYQRDCKMPILGWCQLQNALVDWQTCCEIPSDERRTKGCVSVVQFRFGCLDDLEIQSECCHLIPPPFYIFSPRQPLTLSPLEAEVKKIWLCLSLWRSTPATVTATEMVSPTAYAVHRIASEEAETYHFRDWFYTHHTHVWYHLIIVHIP